MEHQGIQAEVARLVRHAWRPATAPDPGGADDLELAILAQRLGRPLPAELVQWLRICKGDLIGPGGLFGVRHDRMLDDDIASTMDRHPGWRERGWLPVAGDGNGDYYALITDGEFAGHVGFLDQTDYDTVDYIVATNLWVFLRELLREDVERGGRWPADRDHVLSVDPGMAGVPAALTIWRG